MKPLEKINKGYFGIGIFCPKIPENIGTLWRSAFNFKASFIFTIGKRYKKKSSDTPKTPTKIPLFHFDSFEEFKKYMPSEAQLICIEQSAKSKDIKNFFHPKIAIYLLGAEDQGIPEEILEEAKSTIHIDTPMCLNVAVAGSIVLFHRQLSHAS